MKYDLTPTQLELVLRNCDFSDLNTHMGGCTSFVAGVADVVTYDRFVIPKNEDKETIHAFIEVEGQLFDSGGLQYENTKDVVNVVHSYNPFNSQNYRPEHFPNKNFTNKLDIDEYLWDEYVLMYNDINELVIIDDIKSEVSNRVEQKIKDKKFG